MNHFIIFYKGTYSSKGIKDPLTIYGDLRLDTQKDFPNRKNVIYQIKEYYGLKDVSITNILRVTEEELKEYYK